MDPDSISDLQRGLKNDKLQVLNILRRYDPKIQIEDLTMNFINEMFFPKKEENLDFFESLYQCKDCGKSRINYKEVQNRSTDEGAKVSLTCLDCGYTWSE
jgi:DNA-directed RNA polymerase subunit M/transcription elongation factor TFIIS